MKSIILIAISLLSPSTIVFGQGTVYVNKKGSPNPDGSIEKPYHVIQSAISKTKSTVAKNVLISPGKYYEKFEVSTPCILSANGGLVTIGDFNNTSSTSFDVLTLNTHLAGDVVGMPSWKDKARAYDIAHFFNNFNPRIDIIGFQEIWDEDLFYGGDGAAGILPMSGYLTGKHGSLTGTRPGNSGLSLMSKYELSNYSQKSFGLICSGWDCMANKGWITASIKKDNFKIRIYNLHTQADEAPEIRKIQLMLLSDNILSYRTEHPDDVVFIIGDFNIFGENSEYDESLVNIIGDVLDGRDADHNSSNFIREDFSTFTVCDCNPLAMYFDDDTKSGRLDYIFYIQSKNGSCEIVPISTEVIQFKGRFLSDDGLSTSQSSDHWAVYSRFILIRK